MGCVQCGRRQADPVRGASPWKRGVVRGVQVLVCPDCQDAGDWRATLDRCAACGSAALVRRLGETACRECGHVGDSVPTDVVVDAPRRHGVPLADEVGAALDRFFGRAGDQPSP